MEPFHAPVSCGGDGVRADEAHQLIGVERPHVCRGRHSRAVCAGWNVFGTANMIAPSHLRSAPTAGRMQKVVSTARRSFSARSFAGLQASFSSSVVNHASSAWLT